MLKKFWKKKILLRVAVAFFTVFILFLLLNLFFPLKVHISYSTLVVAENNEIMGAFLSSDDKWRMRLEKTEITPEIRKAFLLKEDRYFYYHPGVNLPAAGRALFNNIRYGKRTSGASTITMQLARLLAPKERSYINKIVEVFRALQLEWQYSKDEILEMYLNLIPYGGNLEGIKAAGIMYFGKTPAQLSPAQVSTLTVIPNRPGSLKLGSGNKNILQARNHWLKYYAAEGIISQQELQDALEEPEEIFRRNIEQTAPHFCRMVAKEAASPLIKTTINHNQQKKTEALVQKYINRMRQSRITNAAVLIIDNKTRQVISYVGSADFNDADNSGQVNGVLGIRSPGSTLKPFLYTMAFENGLYAPKTVINDVPVNHYGYTPENFDNTFQGAVTVSFALANSLNIPAVNTLQETGVTEFCNRVAKGGMETIGKNRKKLGLSMILGGCGSNLWELTTMYTCLANHGSFSSLRYLESDSGKMEFSLFSPEAVYMTTRILTQLTRPDLPMNWQNGATVPDIAWKTGTSYGRKDAWSIGYNEKYTVGIWVGNFNAEGVPELSGADVATPLLFQVFESLPGNNTGKWVRPAKKLSTRLICTQSGDIPGNDCVNKGYDLFIPGITKTQDCKCHQLIWVNEKEDLSYCMNCLQAENAHQKAFRQYAPELLAYFESRQIRYEKIPPHNKACVRVFEENGPRISSPSEGAEYLIEKNDDQQLQLMAQVTGDVREVHWYLNDRYLGKSAANKGFFTGMPNGHVKISCTDDKGRTSHIHFTVKRF